MAHSICRSSLIAADIVSNTLDFTQSLYLLKIVFHLPDSGGKSLQGLPVRAIHTVQIQEIACYFYLCARGLAIIDLSS